MIAMLVVALLWKSLNGHPEVTTITTSHPVDVVQRVIFELPV